MRLVQFGKLFGIGVSCIRGVKWA